MDFEYPGLSVQGTNLEATNGHIRLIYRPNRTKYSPAPVEEVQYIYIYSAKKETGASQLGRSPRIDGTEDVKFPKKGPFSFDQ